QPSPGRTAGRLGFIIQLSFCDSEETAELRKLFMIGGKWTIKQIVDLELIYEYIFDADVIPIILIAEARPAVIGDKVTLRIGDASQVREAPGGARPDIDFMA